jgi:hypothetical protein
MKSFPHACESMSSPIPLVHSGNPKRAEIEGNPPVLNTPASPCPPPCPPCAPQRSGTPASPPPADTPSNLTQAPVAASTAQHALQVQQPCAKTLSPAQPSKQTRCRICPEEPEGLCVDECITSCGELLACLEIPKQQAGGQAGPQTSRLPGRHAGRQPGALGGEGTVGQAPQPSSPQRPVHACGLS